MGLHQKSFQPSSPSTSGSSSAARPNSCGTSISARNAPKGPMKLRAGASTPALKKGAGSRGSNVARAMSSIRASANATSPRGSAPRDGLVSTGVVAMAGLDLHHDGDDHGTPLGAPLLEAPELLAHPLAGELGVEPLLGRASVHR